MFNEESDEMIFGQPKYVHYIQENFILIFGTNVYFLSDRELLEKEYINYPHKDFIKELYKYCINAIDNKYPIESWKEFTDEMFLEVNPDTQHDLETDEGAYAWFCEMVRLFADILYEHKIITKEERDEAFKEVKFINKEKKKL